MDQATEAGALVELVAPAAVALVEMRVALTLVVTDQQTPAPVAAVERNRRHLLTQVEMAAMAAPALCAFAIPTATTLHPRQLDRRQYQRPAVIEFISGQAAGALLSDGTFCRN